MPLQIIAGSGAFDHSAGTLKFQAKDLVDGTLVEVTVAPDAVRKLRGPSTEPIILDRWHAVLEQTASTKYDGSERPKEITLDDVDFVGG